MSIQIVKEPCNGMHILLFTGFMESEMIKVYNAASEFEYYSQSKWLTQVIN